MNKQGMEYRNRQSIIVTARVRAMDTLKTSLSPTLAKIYTNYPPALEDSLRDRLTGLLMRRGIYE